MASVYLGRVPYRATQRDVEDLFRRHGSILRVDMKRGFAFIVHTSGAATSSVFNTRCRCVQEFTNKSDAEAAVRALNDSDFMGVRIMVEHSVSKRGAWIANENFWCVACRGGWLG